MGNIKQVQADEFKNYKRQFVGCIVLDQHSQILLQKRGDNWRSSPGCLCEFGGQIEVNETPMDALIRELKEELGAMVNPLDVIHLGAISEEITNYTDLIFTFFWHDKFASITGCYEGEMRTFAKLSDALIEPKLMDSTRWMLQECIKLNLISYAHN